MLNAGSMARLVPPLWVGLPVLVALVFAFAALFLTANVPFHDDYNVIVQYLVNSQGSFVNELFGWHTKHRNTLTRLLAKASLLSGYGLDVRFLIACSALFLMGTVLLIYRSVASVELRRFILLLLCLSVFSLVHRKALMWATAATMLYGVLFLAVLSFYLFSKRHLLAKAGALLFGLAAPYAGSSGLLVLPMLFGWRVLDSRAGGGHINPSLRRCLRAEFLLVSLRVPAARGWLFEDAIGGCARLFGR